MPQRRNRRAGVEDLWTRGDGSPSARHGQGLRWRARWVDPSGREKTKAFRRKVDAQRHVEQVTTALTTSTYVDPDAGRQTVGAALQRYLDGLQVKPKTRDGYASVIRSRIRPRWKDVPLDAVMTSDVAAWVQGLQVGDDAVSPARARQAGLILRAALELAVEDRLLAVNPAERVKLPKQPARREQARLTVDQVHKLADELPNATDRALMLTMALAGLRFGEAAALQVKHLDHQKRRVTVARTYTDLNGSILEGVPKSHAMRWVPMPAGLSDELQQLTEGKTAEDDVFRTRRGSVYRHRNWGRRVFRPALRRAKLDDSMRIHDLRGTFASIAVQAGANIKALQRALGHESAKMTLDTYADLFEDDLGSLGERIDSAAYSLRTEVDEE